MITMRRFSAFLATLALLQLTFGALAASCELHGAARAMTHADARGESHGEMHDADAASADARDARVIPMSMASAATERHDARHHTPCDLSSHARCHGMVSCSSVVAFAERIAIAHVTREAGNERHTLAWNAGQIRAPVPPPPRA